MKLLIELRPALEGHAGIPQEARLLFRGLGQLAGTEVQGLIQSSDKFLNAGLPEPTLRGGALPDHERIDRLSRVVISLQPPAAARSFLRRVVSRLTKILALSGLLLRGALRLREKLTWFDAEHFKDFVWRSQFAKTLPIEDFEQVTSATYRVARVPYGLMHMCGLATAKMGKAIYPRLDTHGVDVMLALTPYPATVALGTKLVVRYFDAVPLMMPHTIIHKARHQALHYQALRRNVASGAYFACCSDATRRDLIAVFPEVESRAVTIPCMLSHHYFLEESSPGRVPEILAKRLNPAAHVAPMAEAAVFEEAIGHQRGVDYLLMVSTLEPRKNHALLIEAWEQLKRESHPQLKLVLVGSLGWDHEHILERMKLWVQRGDVLLLSGVPAEELRVLYRHALTTVCPSVAEGFGYAGVEAMRCGGVVVASDIPVHREVYAEAAEYFNPYSATELVKAITCVIGPEQALRRRQLIETGEPVSARYLSQEILPKWDRFLRTL